MACTERLPERMSKVTGGGAAATELPRRPPFHLSG
jgi:hypothetical protein